MTMNRVEVEQFIQQELGGISMDHPWESNPDHTIYRHSDTRKWFALIARIPYQTLGINKPDFVDFINLKCDPDLIDDLRHEQGILPAYHMNKRHWITVLLDGSCPSQRIQSLILFSHRLTAKK